MAAPFMALTIPLEKILMKRDTCLPFLGVSALIAATLAASPAVALGPRIPDPIPPLIERGDVTIGFHTVASGFVAPVTATFAPDEFETRFSRTLRAADVHLSLLDVAEVSRLATAVIDANPTPELGAQARLLQGASASSDAVISSRDVAGQEPQLSMRFCSAGP